MKKSLATALCFGIVLAVAGAGESEAAKKKSRVYTPAERKEIVRNATKMCKKRFGAPSHVSHIQWRPLKIWCWTN